MSGLETPPAPILRFNGAMLKTLRIKRDYTMEELAAVLNVSVVSISYWESGQYQPRSKKVERLARVFKLKPQDFYYQPAEV